MFLTTKFGKPAKDQTVEVEQGAEVFRSYGSPVAKRDEDGNVTLHPDYWDYSTTTGYYRNQFLGEGIAATRDKIKRGEYKLERF